MGNLLDRLVGVPVTGARVCTEVETFVAARGVESLRTTVNETLEHLTGKSGALLQAQGIFVVVSTYGLSQNWPRQLTLSSLLLLILSALIVMMNLRSVFIGLESGSTDGNRQELENIIRTAQLASHRGVRFNISLYLTFCSVALLGAGAILLG